MMSIPQLFKMTLRFVCVQGKFGAGSDGYWNNELILKQMERAFKIAAIKYPSDQWNHLWIFDQSSGHCAYKKDSLNVSRMNVNPDGAQPKMHDTVWNGKFQKMILSDGRPKGMKLVLEERGVNTDKMKAADMRRVLGNHHDFKHEKTGSISCTTKEREYFTYLNFIVS